ncbi:hypothetical protein [Calothrix sp. 336/3]|uniref:hypothetical protein n=1 Tax=Calothrix sp. 336/3 TaxID=1337936 RepID=UPI0004E3066E|nr:hypothetical protein [Calothrix sp. 336/3]AKG20484.1 hypothetical protein IJ00_03395 [Calothrix sp. 336/3]
MSSRLSPTGIKPLQRLQVNDGLLLTAEGWRQAHDYHRQRQNIYYQSLHQSGIVWGLGVRTIAAPQEVSSEYRDGRWLEIQPGLAIDAQGNPIVVPEALVFRIGSELPKSGFLTVYIVIDYVDPDKLQFQNNRQFVCETFRINEKTSVPQNTEIELCRILLQPGDVELKIADDVFAPTVNEIDLRYRQQAQMRAIESVRIGYLSPGQNDYTTAWSNLNYLAQSVRSLYPPMEGTAVVKVDLTAGLDKLDYDLLYVNYQNLLTLKETEIDIMRQYLQSGALLMVEISAQDANTAELSTIRQELQQAIANLPPNPAASFILQELQTELAANEAAIIELLNHVSLPIREFAEKVGISATRSEFISRNHPLHQQPFLFAQLPSVRNAPINIFNWGGILLVVGSLSTSWSIDTLSLSREAIRNAQEMGINILHFAWQRRQLTLLSQ